MDSNLIPTTFRATIFTNKVPYNTMNVKRALNLFNNKEYLPGKYQPNILPLSGISKDISLDFGWELSLSDEKEYEAIIFQDNKIDIVRKQVKGSSIDENSFLSFSIDAVKKIVDTFGVKVYRIAYAPSYVKILKNETISNFSGKFFKNNLYRNKNIETFTFQNVYRINEQIKDENILINYIVKIEIGNIISETVDSSCAVISNDINTFQNIDKEFEMVSIEDFYTKVKGWNADFIQYINL
jgi:hypothetical protein